jgi:hypothetical protein
MQQMQGLTPMWFSYGPCATVLVLRMTIFGHLDFEIDEIWSRRTRQVLELSCRCQS